MGRRRIRARVNVMLLLLTPPKLVFYQVIDVALRVMNLWMRGRHLKGYKRSCSLDIVNLIDS